jgi:hypothetical protein
MDKVQKRSNSEYYFIVAKLTVAVLPLLTIYSTAITVPPALNIQNLCILLTEFNVSYGFHNKQRIGTFPQTALTDWY